MTEEVPGVKLCLLDLDCPLSFFPSTCTFRGLEYFVCEQQELENGGWRYLAPLDTITLDVTLLDTGLSHSFLRPRRW